MRNKERGNYVCPEYICIGQGRKAEGQQPFLGFEQKNSLVEVAFLGKVCLVIVVTTIHVRCAGHEGDDPHRFASAARDVGFCGGTLSPNLPSRDSVEV